MPLGGYSIGEVLFYVGTLLCCFRRAVEPLEGPSAVESPPGINRPKDIEWGFDIGNWQNGVELKINKEEKEKM